MISMSLKSNIGDALRELKVMRANIPLAMAKAINLTANAVHAAEKQEISRVFDRPTPFTLNSLKVIGATPARLTARVWFKDKRGHPHYLVPQVYGGERQQKFFETVFTMIGLKAGEMTKEDIYIVPGSAARLDAYGNMSRGQIRQILSALGKAERTRGYSANRTAASARRKGRKLTQYFVGRPGGGKLPFGVWQRFGFAMGSAIKPVLIFIKKPKYKKRFDFYVIANRVASREYPLHLDRTLRSASNSSIAG